MMHLILDDMEDHNYKVPELKATDYFIDKFENNSFIMERNCDSKIPEYLEFTLIENLSVADLKNICHKICLEMHIGIYKILNIPLKFLLHLNEHEICDDIIYITIPFDMFSDEIKLVSLKNDDVVFKLTNTDNCFDMCNLISKGTFYDTPIRRKMAEPSKHIVQRLSSVEIDCSTNKQTTFRYKMFLNYLHNCIHKGFFIESDDVDEINEIEIIFYAKHVRMHYNKFMVKKKCVKICKNLLYLPFYYEKSYDDRTKEGFIGSLNIGRINLTDLYVIFDKPQTKICIYGLGSNSLEIKDGICELYWKSAETEHHTDNYNMDGSYTGHQTHFEFENRLEKMRKDALINANLRKIYKENKNAIFKLIEDQDNLQCCISQENIQPNALYMYCTHCNKNYVSILLKKWLAKNNTCPMCRKIWNNNKVYINFNAENNNFIQEINDAFKK